MTRKNGNYTVGAREGMEIAEAFLNKLFNGALIMAGDDTVFIRVLLVWRGEGDGPRGKTCAFHFVDLDAASGGLHEIFALNNLGYDAFVGVNLRWLQSGGKAAVHAASVVHCEIDPTPDLLPADIEALAKGVGASFRVISGPTGGQHVYFVLDALLDPARAEMLNKRLAEKLHCKDAVHDVSRHLRLAGTLNHKPVYRGMPPFRAQLIIEEEESDEIV